MDELENFISKYDSELCFHFEEDMPDDLSGMIVGNNIYVNKRKPLSMQLSTVAEEVGHYQTSSYKDVTNYDKNAKDEAMARRWSYGQLISVDYIARYKDSEDAVLLYEIAEDLELPEAIVESAVYMYKVQGKIK